MMKKENLKKCILIFVAVVIVIAICFLFANMIKNNKVNISGDGYSSGDEDLNYEEEPGEKWLETVNANIELSEKEVLGENVKVTVKLDNDENIYSVMLCPLYNGISEIGEEIEATKIDDGVYEAEINFEAQNAEEGYYQFKAILEDYNGNEKEIIAEDTVNYSKTGVSYAHAYQKEDGRTAVQITALDKGEVLVSTTNVAPTADDARWTKYEAGEEYIIATPEESVENVYVWYKDGEKIINAADSGISVMSFEDGQGIIAKQQGIITNKEADSPSFGKSEYQRKNILSITLSKTNNAPANPIDQWDISQNKDGSVKAYIYTSTEDNTKYDLYICGNGSLIAPRDSKYLFGYYTNCKKINGLENLDVSNVTIMKHMFNNCSNWVTDLAPLQNWQVGNVTDMLFMFYDCSGITDLAPLANWQVGNVTDMSNMFSFCSGITDLAPLQSWDVSSVTVMNYMFGGCKGITNLAPLQSWDVSSVTVMAFMFSSCSGITDLAPLQSWDVSSVTDMSYMFDSCSGITNLAPLQSWDVSSVTSIRGIFSSCSGITDLAPLTNWEVSSVTNMSRMFDSCSAIADLTPLTNWEVSSVTDMSYMFNECINITNIEPLTNWKVDSVKNMSGMFGTIFASHSMKITDLEPLRNWNVSSVTNMSEMFFGCTEITNLEPLRAWNVSNVTNMSKMFGYDYASRMNIISIEPLKDWNVSSVTNMSNMFLLCGKIEVADLSSWNGNKLTNVCGMFYGCHLKYLILGQSFKIITSNNDIQSNFCDLNTTSIITLRTEPIELKKGTTNNKYNAICNGNLFVPNSTSNPTIEQQFEAADTDGMFGAERIKPILELIGDKTVTTNLGSKYEDPGVNVAGYPSADLLDYPELELTLETDTSQVEEALRNGTTGDYTVTYTLKYKDEVFATETRTVTIQEAPKPPFIMEWTIPAGADGTDENGNLQTIITLPIKDNNSNDYNNYTVDWGDGKTNTYTTEEFPEHIYNNTNEEVYEIKITGKVYSFGYNSYNNGKMGNSTDYRPTKDNKYSKFYTFTQYLTSIKSWGKLEIVYYSFAFCENLESIASPEKETFKNVVSFDYCFQYCTKLKSIPADLFDSAVNVISFSNTFRYCSGLSGAIPADLFVKNTSATNFLQTFYNCSGLTGSIPAELFAKNTNATTFSYAFSGCSGLTGSIPAELFANNTNATTFANTFSRCIGLTGTIPAELFANNASATDFSETFYNCSGLTGSIPAELFAKNTNATTFSYAFSGCSGLTGSIPAELFANNTNATTFANTFSGCRGLTGTIPAELFANNASATDFSQTFYNCSGLTSSFININTEKVTRNYGMFAGCTNIKYLLLGKNFDKIQSVKSTYSFQNYVFAEKGTSIITLREEPIEFLKYSSYDQYCPATLYVKNSTSNPTIEQKFEEADTAGMFGAERIKEVIELIGDSTIIISTKEEYTELGANVAGHSPEDLKDCPQLGLTFEIDTRAVDNALANKTPGEYDVTYTLKLNNEVFSVATRKVNITVIKDKLKIPTLSGEYTYTGTEQTITLNNFNQDLMDVTENKKTDAGDYTAVVTLKDPTSYIWEDETDTAKNIPWKIAPKNVEVVWDNVLSWVYDGNPHIPTATAPTDITNETISLSITGEITDVGNGTATASISGVSGGQGRIENYTLTNTTKDFTITRLGIARPTASDKTYSRTEQSGVPEGTGYTLGGQVKGINAGPYTTTVTLDKNHKWSTGEETEVLSLSWKINPKTITAEMIELAYSTTVYTGSALQPGVTVKDGAATLVNPDEYTVAYTENTNVGTATVTITGIGNYTGTPTKTFTITRKPIAKPIVTNRIYNRSEQIGVEEGTGYKLSGKTKATDVGSYEVTVTLDSNYKWSDNGTDETANVTLTWKIDPKTITSEMIELAYSTTVYTGSALQPEVTVVDGTATLINSSEYTVSYANNTNVGTATVTIAGTGNYTGTPTVEFTITRKGIDVPTGTDYIYNGTLQTGVNEGTGYTVTGTPSAIDAGTYTATVTPTSNYQWKDGTSKGKNITWKIAQKSIEVTWEGVFTWQYDGTPHIPTATAQSGVQNETIVLSVTTAQSNVGDHVATASISKVNGGQGRIENYVLTNTTKPFKITQREIAVIWLPEQDKYEYTYNGQLQGPDVQTEVESALGEIITFGVRGKEKDVGSYTAEAYIVSITNGVAENYKVTNTNKEFVINRKDITVKADANQGKGPGEPEPDLTFTYEGNIAGEIPGFTGSLAREEGEGGGRYRIRRGTLELADTDTFKAGNYNLIFIDEDTEFVISYDKEKELILVFKITDTNNKLILPIPASTSNDYMIIWGDNNSDMYTKEGFPEHTYAKAGTYTVEIGGTVKNFGYYNSLRPTDSNIYNNYLSYINQLTGIEQLGDVDAERIGFAFCENLTGDIPEANLDLSDLVSAENMFNNCVLLQGPIPTNLLAGAEKVNSAKNMFLNCENLTGTIPANLFADTTEITTFESTFNNCKKLDGTIPAELFVNGENVTTYAGTFKDCANLDGEIPAELFGNSTRVTTFKETFSNCTGLNTTISPKLFGTNPYVRNYYRTFYNCTGITGTIDRNTFSANMVITEIPESDANNNFKQTFENCTGINKVELAAAIIGNEMFKGCTSIEEIDLEEVIDIGYNAFYGCNLLKVISADENTLRTIGTDAFEYTGTNPEKLLTKINRENETLLEYVWDDDNRLIDVEPPKGTLEIITPRDPFTKDEPVDLRITVTDNYSSYDKCVMVIMNEKDYDEFANREYRDYDSLEWKPITAEVTEIKNWELTPGDDLKTVYVLFKDEFGNMNVVKDVLN